MVKHKVQHVLQTEMDRSEFLKRSGVVLLGVAGITTISKTFFNAFSNKSSAKPAGYGASPYGR
jgi:hypothetical protein